MRNKRRAKSSPFVRFPQGFMIKYIGLFTDVS
ncbi:hypothetical protein BSNT_09131 [Bacillus subtilis subsp. natto BEST195]|nr:hypothetical protein BSNT_09131 [Bacillus subtilis subsp. natto BEST195]